MGKCEEHRDKKYDNDLKLQRLYDILLQPVIQQLGLEDRDGSAAYESVKRRADNWILMNSMGQAEMDLSDNGKLRWTRRQRRRRRTGLGRRQ